MKEEVRIPMRVFTSYELLHEYYGDDSNLLELGLYESDETLVVGHSPNAYSFNPQYFTGENQYVPNYVPDSPFDPVPPTVPPTEPPTPTPTPTPVSMNKYFYIKPEKIGDDPEGGGQYGIPIGILNESHTPLVTTKTSLAFIKFNGDISFTTNGAATFDSGDPDYTEEYFYNDYEYNANNNTVAVKLRVDHQGTVSTLLEHTYTFDEYLEYIYGQNKNIDFGMDVFPIGICFGHQELENFLKQEISEGIEITKVAAYDIDAPLNNDILFVIPAAVLDEESDVYSADYVTLLNNYKSIVSPNVTQSTNYKEGLLPFYGLTSCGIVDLENNIDSNNNPNTLTDALELTDFIVVGISENQEYKIGDGDGLDPDILMLAPNAEINLDVTATVEGAEKLATYHFNICIDNDEVVAIATTDQGSERTKRLSISDCVSMTNYTDVYTTPNGIEMVPIRVINIVKTVLGTGSYNWEDTVLTEGTGLIILCETDEGNKYYEYTMNINMGAGTYAFDIFTELDTRLLNKAGTESTGSITFRNLDSEGADIVKTFTATIIPVQNA